DRAKGADGVAVQGSQVEAVVGSAVANLLAAEIGKRDLQIAPAGKIVVNLVGPALGVIAARVGVAVVEKIDVERAAAFPAIEPERDALIGAPVARRPGGKCLV